MYTINIVGGSASGKTTLAKKLQHNLKDCVIISQDNYHNDMSHLTRKELSEHNFDTPDALNLNQLVKDIKLLNENGNVKIQKYDFVSQISSKNHFHINKPKFLIIEGLFTLYTKDLIEVSDMRIFIDVNTDERLNRRILRDTTERGDTKKEVIERFNKFVEIGHQKYVQPQINKSDYIVSVNSFEDDITNITELIKILNK